MLMHADSVSGLSHPGERQHELGDIFLSTSSARSDGICTTVIENARYGPRCGWPDQAPGV